MGIADTPAYSTRLRVLRASRKYTQDQVARAIGCSISRYSRIEGGRLAPTHEQQGRLAKLYAVPAEVLFADAPATVSLT